jgi:photosystem II stability/assembly factor-like uncharacterized protein
MRTWTSRIALILATMGLLALAGGLAFAQTAPTAPTPPVASAALTADDLGQFGWRWIGPVNFSGRITEFAVPRGQTTTYYVLTASGGLWKTEDAGTHFEPIFDKAGSMSMGYLAIAPSDPKILYLGTGEPMHARASTHGDGVWKSLDAGKTWAKVGLEKSFFIPKIAVDPKNPDVVYVAAEGKLYDNALDCERGLYKSTDGGKTWANVFPVKDRGVADFVIDPRDANVVVAAAYKTYRRAWTYMDRQPGNNLYKTTDGGSTWKMLESGLPIKAELGRTGLAILEKNPAVLYARLDEEVNLGLAERDGVANFRAAGGFGGGGQSGVFTEDWTLAKLKTYKIPAGLAKQAPKFTPLAAENEADLVKKLNEFIGDKDALTKAGIDLAKLNAAARKTFDKNKDVLAAVNEIEALLKKEAPKADSGEAKGRAQIVNRHALEMLYGGVLRNQAPVKREGVVYRTDDQGETWKRMTEYKTSGGSAQVNQTEGGYYGRIYVDQTNDQIVYCVDTNITISKDGGKTFAASGWDAGNYKLHVDHRGMWVDPANGSHVMSANDGGAGESWDGGKHWSQKATISAQQFYDVFVDNEQPYNVMGGTQDNGAWIGPSRNRNQWGVFAADWTYLPTGDGFYVVRDWWNPDWIYYESQFGSSSRMNLKTGENAGLQKRNTPEETAAGVPAQRYQWNAPIVLSPHNPGIVYICSQFVHRSLSRGERNTFVTISPDLSKADKTKLDEAKKTNLQWATIYTFAESAKKPGLYWAGTDDGNLWMSPDSGGTWVSLTDKFYDKAGKPKPVLKGVRIPYDKWVKRVVPSAFDENVCYVAYSGYRTHNEDKTYLYVTRDKGQTFEDISGGLMNPLFDVEEDPDNASILFVSGDFGIHMTMDGGKTWTPMAGPLPHVVVRDMAIQKREREMAVATYGRGFYIVDIGPLKELKPEVFAKDAYLFDIKDVVRWNTLDRKGEQYGEFAKVDNPPIGATLYYYLKAEAKSVKLTVKDLEGTLIQEIASGSAKKGLQKVFWSLNRQAAGSQTPAGAPAGGGGGGQRGGGLRADNGTYKVTLSVDGKDVATKKVTLLPDPLFK